MFSSYRSGLHPSAFRGNRYREMEGRGGGAAAAAGGGGGIQEIALKKEMRKWCKKESWGTHLKNVLATQHEKKKLFYLESFCRVELLYKGSIVQSVANMSQFQNEQVRFVCSQKKNLSRGFLTAVPSCFSLFYDNEKKLYSRKVELEIVLLACCL